MASANKRRKVGIGLLGSGVVGEAIQDIVFQDVKGQVGDDIELEIRKIYTRNPKNKKWFATPKKSSTTLRSISSSKHWAFKKHPSCRRSEIISYAHSKRVNPSSLRTKRC